MKQALATVVGLAWAWELHHALTDEAQRGRLDPATALLIPGFLAAGSVVLPWLPWFLQPLRRGGHSTVRRSPDSTPSRRRGPGAGGNVG